MSRTESTTQDFHIVIDRAMHTTATNLRAEKTVSGYDFGIFGRIPDAINAWMELDDATHEALRPAINAMLLQVWTMLG
jgi:hypothetical protein